VEQYYSSNIQRNQLVQKDIRVAKRLQNEEQERAQMLHEQATRQLEDQDSEYAHRIQEEIQRAAEEERRREEKDKEIAKRIQEEEDLYIRQRNSCRRTDGRVNGITIGSPNTLQPRQPLFREEEESARHSWVRSPSSSTSDYEAEHCEHRRPLNRDSTNSFEQRRQSVREQPLRRRSVQSRSSFASQSSTTGNLQGGWTDVVQLIKNDLNEQGYLSCSSEDELFEPVYKLERILSRRQQSSERHGVQGTRLSRHCSMREGNTRMWPGDQVSRMERYRHSDYKDSRSVRSASRPVRRYSSSDCKSGDRQRRVRFQEGNNFYTDGQRAFEENHVGKRNPNNCTVRPYQGNVSGDQRTSWGEINRPCRYEAKGVRTSFSQATREDEEYSGRFRERGSFEGGSCRVQTEHRPKAHSVRKEWRQEGGESSRHARGEYWQGNQGDRSSTEEEEMDREYERRREETRAPRQPRRSLSASFRGSSPGPGQSKNRPSLDLGELRQVLQDEELARKLQEEEEELL
ncbi:hypothetical protein C0J45_14138, partial [Silurus meridionalis]